MTQAVPDERPSDVDPVTVEYRRHLDLTLLRKNLALTPEERFVQLMQLQRLAGELRRAARQAAGA